MNIKRTLTAVLLLAIVAAPSGCRRKQPVSVTLVDGHLSVSNVVWAVNNQPRLPLLLFFRQPGDTDSSHRVDTVLPDVSQGDRLLLVFTLLSGATVSNSLVVTNSTTDQVILFVQPDGGVEQATRWPEDDRPFRVDTKKDGKPNQTNGR